MDRPKLQVTDLGEFIRYGACKRRFVLGYDNHAIYRRDIPNSADETMDPSLLAEGLKRKSQWERHLLQRGFARYSARTWQDFTKATKAQSASVFARDLFVRGTIGAFEVSGRIDFAVFNASERTLSLIACKSTRRDKTHQRIQALALFQLASFYVLPKEVVLRAFVARVGATHTMQTLEELSEIPDETSLLQDIQNLLAQDGPLFYALQNELSELPYHLCASCDDCRFATHCFVQGAKNRSLELLGLDPATIRTLDMLGVQTLSDLANLNANKPDHQRAQKELSEDLPGLITRAKARQSTLPNAPQPWNVLPLPHRGTGSLPSYLHPPHRTNAAPQKALVRIFLSIHYDYAEHRICGIAAHITQSLGTLHTATDGTLSEIARDQRKTPLAEDEILELRRGPWSGQYEVDTGAEAHLLQSAFRRIVSRVRTILHDAPAPIHFYVWSEQDQKHLLEACNRAGQGLLSHVRHLMGAREGLEQQIISVLQPEISSRYATGWTSQSLETLTSLRWFGQNFSWTRSLPSGAQNLSALLHRDVFDAIEPSTLTGEETEALEIRLRHSGNLSMPYWHAFWGLFSDKDVPEDYLNAQEPGILEAFMRARVQALRWMEERIKPKNRDIHKPLISPQHLPHFQLQTGSIAEASLDFVRFDHETKRSFWRQEHLQPPSHRITRGASLPLCNVKPGSTTLEIVGQLHTAWFPPELQDPETHFTFRAGNFVRLHPAHNDPNSPQSLGLLHRGHTCVVQEIDWENSQCTLSIIPSGRSSSRYVLPSYPLRESLPYATLDASLTDFVSMRVDRCLAQIPPEHRLCAWFDPVHPQVPGTSDLSHEEKQRLQTLLETITPDTPLLPRRIALILQGLQATIQLIQGPPGTGKTTVSALSILVRILRMENPRVLIAAHTHTAVDTLLERVERLAPHVFQAAQDLGLPTPALQLFKVSSNPDTEPPLGHNIERFKPQGSKRMIQRAERSGAIVIGASTAGALKLSSTFTTAKVPFEVPLLVIDEASMLVGAHMIALASILAPSGQLLVTGDHRQLSPIIAHDWDNEDRPPARLYRAHESAFSLVSRLADEQPHVVKDSLHTTYRLPAQIRRLIQPLYDKDAITLLGSQHPTLSQESALKGAESIWQDSTSLYLVTHDEDESSESNHAEISLIKHILHAGLSLGAIEPNSVAVIAPHRAQRAALQTALSPWKKQIRMVDTVERLQGGEAPTVIYSATASDPAAIGKKADFILGLERSNVAFSRTQRRLIVICARSLLNHIPAETEHYDAALLWKYLRHLCTHHIGGGEIGWTEYQILRPPHT